MNLETHVETIAQWLDATDVGAAPSRIADALAHNAVRESSGNYACATYGEILKGAYHEAAHSVVARAFGLRAGRVCVRSDASGSSAYEFDQADLDSMQAATVAHLAGVALELIFCGAGEDPQRRFALRNSADILNARCDADACRALAPSLNLTNRTFAVLAVGAVISNMDAIERIAGALQASGELAGGAVEALCGQLQ